ncbi:MAG: NAD(P)-dependent alcohol dehydrogenase, partial [Pseudomonadota bacterium]
GRPLTKSWTLTPGQGPGSLRLADADEANLGAAEVRIAIKANSINARDLMIALGKSPLPVADSLTPLSDGAGEVIEVGSEVHQFAPGDRVVAAFNPAHLDGPYSPAMEPSAFGGVAQGLLSESVVLPASALARLPEEVSYEQAACLPCAGVVAWNALFETGTLRPGDTVFATGTGAVSLIAMQLAKAAGATFGISSSSDSTLQKALGIGADFGLNYAAEPQWDEALRRATQGRGADVILETAGPPSIATSIRAAAQGGRVAQIGFAAPEGPPINVLDMLVGGVSVNPVMVGSRAMLERLVRAVAANTIEVPVARSFAFADAPLAFEAAMHGAGLGKITITHR